MPYGLDVMLARLLQMACEGDEDEPVEDRDAEERDEPDARGDGERYVAKPERDHTSNDREGDVQEDERRGADRAEGQPEEKEDQRERQRDHHHEPRLGLGVVLELASVLGAIAGRQLHLATHALTHVLHDREKVAPSNVELDGEPA